MAEVSVFDAYQVQRALRGHLADDDVLETLARDDATGAFWVLTRRELIIVLDQRVRERAERGAIEGDVETTDVAVTVRLRPAAANRTIVGTFRKPNRLTRALSEIIGTGPR
jgi:hypothetical protein